MQLTPFATLILTGCLTASTAYAGPSRQETDDHAAEQAAMRANLEHKLAKEFLAHGGWRLDYDAARAEAQREKKMLFIYFTRSYAG
jgi:hypothetical protein